MTKSLERWSARLLDPAWHLRAAIILGLAIGAAAWFEWIDDEQVADLKLESVKLALQLLVLGIVVGTLKRAFDDARANSQFRLEVVTDLGKAHARIYCLRRDLWLRGNDPTAVRECIFELMRVRCDLGDVRHDVRSRPDVGQDMVLKRIEDIRGYLEELIDEAMQGAHDGTVGIGPKLQQFIAGADGRKDETSAYSRRFKDPYQCAKMAVDPNWKPDGEKQRLIEREPTSP